MRKIILLFLILISFCSTLQAEGGLDQLQHFLRELNGLQADFQQTVISQEAQQTATTHGVFYLQRPNQFRWDYDLPENQQVIADGRQIWVYDPELEQVSVQSQKSALKGTPAMLMISGDSVEDYFTLIDRGEREGLGWVELAPRDEESQFERILLAFSDNQLARMEMRDKFGQLTQFDFSNIRTNPQFTSRFFQFEPPLNVDIYSQ